MAREINKNDAKHRDKREDNIGISTIDIDGRPCTDAKTKVKVLNNHFKSVFTKICNTQTWKFLPTLKILFQIYHT